MWAFKENETNIAAILISASLFSRLNSSRRQYPLKYWPEYDCVEELADWAYKQWNADRAFYTWQHYHTQVLPHINRDSKFKINNMNELINYLAEEHARVFIEYRPIYIEFVNKCDPFIEKALEEQYKLEHERIETIRKITEEKKIDILKRAKDSRWRHLTKEELEKLVWSKPTIILAQELGVSDVAIAKRCRSLGIKKPERGFWAKVKAGIIPDPQGNFER